MSTVSLLSLSFVHGTCYHCTDGNLCNLWQPREQWAETGKETPTETTSKETWSTIMKQFMNGRLLLNVIFSWQCSTSEVIQSIALLCSECTFVLANVASRTWAKQQKSWSERFSLKFVEVPLADNKSSNWKECCRNEFPKQAANADHMPTVQCGYLVTSLPLSSQPVCTHSHRHVLQPHPNNSLQKDPGRLTPPPICPCTPHSPLLHPLPLTPSAADHCLLSLSFTALLVWGAGPNRYIIVWSSLASPSPANLAWPHSQTSKAPSVWPNSQGVRERGTAQEGEWKQGGEKGDDGWERRKGNWRENERHLKGCSTDSPKVSIKKFSPYETFLLLFFLQTWCLLIFFSLPPFIFSFNFSIPKSSNPTCFMCIKLFSDYPVFLIPWPASLLLHPSLHHPPTFVILL